GPRSCTCSSSFDLRAGAAPAGRWRRQCTPGAGRIRSRAVRAVLLRRGGTALAAALTACIAGCGGGHRPVEPVRLGLDFTPNAAHAGIFAAVHDRRDRAHGVHLVVREPSASTDSLKLLQAGRAELAVLDIHDLGPARE